MGKPQPLDVFANVVLDGSGNGIARIGPTRVHEHWQPSAVFVSVTTHVLEAQAALFVGSTTNPNEQYSQTGTGSSGDTCSMGGIDLQSGTYILVQWTGGDAGQTATMRVLGTYSIGVPSLL